MRLTDQITAEGRRLFQLRSAMPVVLLPALYFALLQMAHFEQRWGEQVEDFWLAFCVCISALGLLMRCLTVGFVPAGTSGRGQGTPSASTLNTLGMYSIVRSPLYLANGVMWFGVALATSSGWFVIVSVLVYWIYIERVIAAEEAFLEAHFGDTFRHWAQSTPCFLPRPSLWRAPAMHFSLRTVLRREHSGLIAVGVMIPLIKFISNTLIEGEPPARWVVTDRAWVIFLAATLFCGLILKLMKKRHWLDAVGR
ncbi:MAG TPA: isoprenylcysteine carboxylmethyltransferase family protein [Steroidobacteraceae bacterium]|jgi:protein-S-isoprenylcysteine O-methyltransferase Ste14|nr:isoprenylcysteine carboxylmethyltransferase family protein [Steroidobacteraceae bacterium]